MLQVTGLFGLLKGVRYDRPMSERRSAPRQTLDIYFNKYLDGQPHLCRSLDLSVSGMRALRLSEPDSSVTAFPVELRLPGDAESLWIWAQAVRLGDAEQGLQFVGIDDSDRGRISRYLAA